MLTGPAAHLAAARVAAGRDPSELASLLGITYEWYDDLERFDDEMTETISFRQLVTLANVVALDLRRLFDADAVPPLTFADLARLLDERRLAGAIDLDTLEDEVGWGVKAGLEDPDALADLPAAALSEIGAHVGADWRGLLPASG